MRLEIPAQRTLVHSCTVPIRWSDMDAMGHVNNATYFTYFEIARVGWLGGLGAPPNPSGEGPVVVNAWCNYHHQLEYPGDAVVRLYAGNAGRSSFETWLAIERADAPGRVHASGGATTVWVDFAAQRSRPLPDWLRARIP